MKIDELKRKLDEAGLKYGTLPNDGGMAAMCWLTCDMGCSSTCSSGCTGSCESKCSSGCYSGCSTHRTKK